LAGLAQRVEENIRATGVSQIEANEVGLSILPELRTIDLVAYLRFASVYQAFDSLNDFESAIVVLRAEEESKGDSA
jgi:transcriptional repressor NrdR